MRLKNTCDTRTVLESRNPCPVCDNKQWWLCFATVDALINYTLVESACATAKSVIDYTKEEEDSVAGFANSYDLGDVSICTKCETCVS